MGTFWVIKPKLVNIPTKFHLSMLRNLQVIANCFIILHPASSKKLPKRLFFGLVHLSVWLFWCSTAMSVRPTILRLFFCPLKGLQSHLFWAAAPKANDLTFQIGQFYTVFICLPPFFSFSKLQIRPSELNQALKHQIRPLKTRSDL